MFKKKKQDNKDKNKSVNKKHVDNKNKRMNDAEKLLHASYTTVRSTAFYDANSKNVSTKNYKSFSHHTMDLTPGDTFLFKRAQVRENGDIGYDYTSFTASAHTIANYYKDLYHEKSNLLVAFLFLISYVSIFVLFLNFSGEQLFWYSGDNAGEFSAFLLTNSLIMLCSFFAVITIGRPFGSFLAHHKFNHSQNVLKRWASVAFEIAEKDNNNQAFKDLLVRWDYVGENFVNDKVAESFENYVSTLSDTDFINLAHKGITLSFIEQELQKDEDSDNDNPVYKKLFEEAEAHGNAVRQLILDEFSKSFDKVDEKKS